MTMTCFHLVFLVLPVTTEAGCAENTDIVTVAVQGYFFERSCERLTQVQAKNECIQNGGWLAEPKNSRISEKLRNTLEGKEMYGHYYSGLEKNNDGNWMWNNNETVSWTNWTKDRPNGDAADIGPCMVHGAGMAWFEADCTKKRRFLCQYDYCDKNGYPCQNGGKCGKSHPYSCQCTGGFYGSNCSETYCQNHSSVCQNGGSCNPSTTSPYYSCDCSSGYFGLHCEDKEEIPATAMIIGCAVGGAVFAVAILTSILVYIRKKRSTAVVNEPNYQTVFEINQALNVAAANESRDQGFDQNVYSVVRKDRGTPNIVTAPQENEYDVANHSRDNLSQPPQNRETDDVYSRLHQNNSRFSEDEYSKLRT